MDGSFNRAPYAYMYASTLTVTTAILPPFPRSITFRLPISAVRLRSSSLLLAVLLLICVVLV